MARGTRRTTEDRLRAALAYCMTGTSKKAAKLCGIPDRTIREMTEQEWWPDLIAEVKKSKDGELDAILTDVIHEGLGIIQDRFQHGDEVLLKDGTRDRKKISARDAAWIAAVMKDKRNALRGVASKVVEHRSTQEQFKDIKKELKTIANTDKPEEDNNKALH